MKKAALVFLLGSKTARLYFVPMNKVGWGQFFYVNTCAAPATLGAASSEAALGAEVLLRACAPSSGVAAASPRAQCCGRIFLLGFAK